MAIATYDETYMTDHRKVDALVKWILTSDDPAAVKARQDIGTTSTRTPSQATKRLVQGYLYGQKSDPAALINACVATSR
jgi:hypothetical protein